MFGFGKKITCYKLTHNQAALYWRELVALFITQGMSGQRAAQEASEVLCAYMIMAEQFDKSY